MDFDFSESTTPDSGNELGEILDMIGHKCSICFTADSDTELTVCGDQFCFGCIETYSGWVLNNLFSYWKGKLTEGTWGIRPVCLDCPVCRQLQDNSSWMQWVNSDLRLLYGQMRAKRTLIMRTCRDCGHEQTILGEEIDEALLLLLDTLEEELGDSAFTILSHRIKTGDLTSVLCHLKRQLRSPIPTPKLVYFLRKLLQDSRGDDVGLFANKQLAVLGMCSGTFCDFCTMRICLRCGQSDWHEGDTCLEFAQKRLETLSLNDPEYSSLNWMVKYGKSCPKCFLLISKEEDGSCNQIKCTFCGFSFCWECLREWSSACGYYRCSLTQKSDETSDLIKSSSQKNRKPAGERTEAGIPDVTKLPSFSPS